MALGARVVVLLGHARLGRTLQPTALLNEAWLRLEMGNQ